MPPDSHAPILAGRFTLDTTRPLIMGVVNLTPDSFSDGGRFADPGAAITHARLLVGQGADLLDLGAESTRPGAPPVPAAEELRRLLPVLEGLADLAVPVSIDTRHASVMRAVLSRGASMINDVHALQDDGAIGAVLDSEAAVCLMHMQGTPLTMQQAPVYRDVVSEVADFLHSRCDMLRRAGMVGQRMVVDPGIGFGKRLAHNLALLAAGHRIRQRCGVPVLVGASRKSMLGELTGQPVTGRLSASVAAALAAVAHGASIVRVHDVGATRDALSVWQAVADEASNSVNRNESHGT